MSYYKINNLEQYFKHYNKSIREPRKFWGKIAEERAAFFVGISRAKRVLVLTTAAERERPAGHKKRWDEIRTPHQEFLSYAIAQARA